MNTYKDVTRRETIAGRDVESGDKELGAFGESCGKRA